MSVGAQHRPLGLHALWGLRAAGVVGGRPRGGWPATVVGGVWCQALSLPRQPVLWVGQPGSRDSCVPGAVGAGVGTQHRPHSVRPFGPALLAVGVAEGRPRGGCLPPLRGASEVRCSPSPDCPPSGWAVGVRHPRAAGAGVWVWGPSGRGPLPAGRGCGVLACGPGCPWHLVPCRGSSCVVRASRVRGTRAPLWLGTCPCAVVVAGGVPLWRASWPRVGAPLLVRSGRSRCSGRLSRRRGAFPHPGGGPPRLYWVAARDTWGPAENRAHCACCWPVPRQGRWARSASYPFGAPRWGCPWWVPPASVLGCVRCGGLACVDPVTDASGFLYRPSFDGGLGRCTGAVSCGRRHRPFQVGGRHARVPRVCVCVLFRAGSGGPASRARFGASHFSFGRSWCALCLFGPLRAVCAPFVVVVGFFFFLFSFSPLVAPPLCPALRVFLPRLPCDLASCPPAAPPPPFFPLPPPVCALLSPAFRVFRPRVPSALASCCPPPLPPLFFLFFAPPIPCCLWRFLLSGCLGPLRPRPLFFVFFAFSPSFFAGCAVRGGFVRLGPSGVPACDSVVLSLSLLCVRWLVLCGVGCWAWLSCAVSWWGLVSCFGGAVLVWPRGSPLCGLAWCVLVFRCPVLCSVALCCPVVVCCRALPFVCVVACAYSLFLAIVRLQCVFWGVVLCVPCPLRPVRCCAALCWCPFVVLCTSSVLFLVAGVVGSRCRCLLLGVCWWLWLPGVFVCWCVSALAPVSGLAVARRLPCGVLLPYAVSGGAVLPCGAVLWCPIFFFCFSPCWWR